MLQRPKGSFRNTPRATPRLIVHYDGVDELADVLSPGDASDASPAGDAKWDGVVCVDATKTSVDAARTN